MKFIRYNFLHMTDNKDHNVLDMRKQLLANLKFDLFSEVKRETHQKSINSSIHSKNDSPLRAIVTDTDLVDADEPEDSISYAYSENEYEETKQKQNKILLQKQQRERLLRSLANNSATTQILKDLREYEFCKSQVEYKLRICGNLSYEALFSEELGLYLFKLFLTDNQAEAKALFIEDLILYQKIRFTNLRKIVAKLIYNKYLASDSESAQKFDSSKSVFDLDLEKITQQELSNAPPCNLIHISQFKDKNFDNLIGVYGDCVRSINSKIVSDKITAGLFSCASDLVEFDLKNDQFPRFLQSKYFEFFIRIKWLETQPVDQNQFEILKLLGKGGFGHVYACKKKDSGHLYAVKQIQKSLILSKRAEDNILNERHILKQLKSKFVTTLKYAFQDELSVYLVMELLLGGTLKQKLHKLGGKMSAKQSKIYAAQILLGLEHLHSRSIIYKDLKLENVVLDEKLNARLTDFGLSVIASETNSCKGYSGTAGYVAPEMINSKDKKFSFACDYFSFGVLLFRLLCGRKPFKGKTMAELNKSVANDDVEYPTFLTLTTVKFLTELLQKDPHLRLGSKQGAREIKNHQYFDSIDWSLLEAQMIAPDHPIQDAGNLLSTYQMTKSKFTDVARVNITNQFNTKFQHFNYVSHTAVQQEVIEALKLLETPVRRSRSLLNLNLDKQETKRTIWCCC